MIFLFVASQSLGLFTLLLYQEEENFADNNIVEMVSEPGSKCSAIRAEKNSRKLFGMYNVLIEVRERVRAGATNLLLLYSNSMCKQSSMPTWPAAQKCWKFWYNNVPETAPYAYLHLNVVVDFGNLRMKMLLRTQCFCQIQYHTDVQQQVFGSRSVFLWLCWSCKNVWWSHARNICTNQQWYEYRNHAQQRNITHCTQIDHRKFSTQTWTQKA